MKNLKLFDNFLVESLVDNPNFKRWFNGSKVVDDKGNPLVVYHGTGSDFSEFNSKKSFNTAGYFAVDPAFANEFARAAQEYHGGNANVVPVYLSIKNPIDLSSLDGGYDDISPRQFIEALPFKLSKELNEKILKMANLPLFAFIGDNSVIDEARAKGYDGVKFIEATPSQHNEYSKNKIKTGLAFIAFDNKQIKSATGNNGNFDVNNPNITENRLYQ